MIQEVAETFDVLPRIAKVEERVSPFANLPAASRAELWSAGNGSNGNGNGKHSDSDSEFIAISPASESDIHFSRTHTPKNDSRTSFDDLGAAFSRSGLGRGNNGRVYDALKRAESAQRTFIGKIIKSQNGTSDNVSVFRSQERT